MVLFPQIRVAAPVANAQTGLWLGRGSGGNGASVDSSRPLAEKWVAEK